MNAKDADLTAGKVSRLKLKWAFGFPGATAMYSQTIYAGRVFVSSNAGYVYSLDSFSITKLLQLQRLICARLGIKEAEQDEEVKELSSIISVHAENVS